MPSWARPGSIAASQSNAADAANVGKKRAVRFMSVPKKRVTSIVGVTNGCGARGRQRFAGSKELQVDLWIGRRRLRPRSISRVASSVPAGGRALLLTPRRSRAMAISAGSRGQSCPLAQKLGTAPIRNSRFARIVPCTINPGGCPIRNEPSGSTSVRTIRGLPGDWREDLNSFLRRAQ
jgi:hypothetical protein